MSWGYKSIEDVRAERDAAVLAERERCVKAIQNHDGFTAAEKRIAIEVITAVG